MLPREFYLLLSPFCTYMGPSFNFCKLLVCMQELLSTSVNFFCILWNYRQLSSRSWDFHQLLSTLCGSAGSAVNFSVILGNFSQLHHLSARTWNLLIASFNISCIHVNFRQLSTIFRASTGLSVKIRQISVRLLDLASTSFNASCIHETLC